MGNLCASSRKSLVIISSNRASTSVPSTDSFSTATYKGSSTGGSSSNLGSSNENLSSNVGHPDGRILETSNLRIFTFAELRQATRNFKPETLIGEGGFGKVYKGWVDENTLNPTKTGLGIMIAVKKLKYESVQGLEEWQSEVTFLGRLSHPNLVKLLGYCWEDKELLLVYEYMSKGSLENHLFRKGEPLSWTLRLKILRGAAQGLAFLHSSEKQIIYRDFKASNILLDLDYSSKLSDFGLAKNGPTGEDSHVTTRVIGTYGYAAPEYVATGHLYVKSDVYGFGVVLLEMLTGRRALDLTKPSGEMNLVNWAKPFLLDRKKFARIMDPRLEGQYPSKAAFEAAQLTIRCIALDPRSRPSMQEVLGTLQKIEASETKSKQKPNREQHSPMRHHRPSPRNDRRDLGSGPSHYKN